MIIAIATDGLDAMALMVWPALDASTVDVARPSGPMHVYISIFQPLVSGGLAQFAEDIAGKSLIS